MRTTVTLVLVLALSAAAITSTAAGEPKRLKVFILAGQSNMEGHVKESTFGYLKSDPATAPLLKEMRNADDTPRICDNVWISYLYGGPGGGEGAEKHGKLTVGYGAQNEPKKIGPEFTFGIYLQKTLNEPILLIKTAWGGKSLNTDFRPPGSGPYELNPFQLDLYTKQGKDIDKLKAEKAAASGRYYRLMTEHVKNVLADIKKVYPDYDPKQGYELAGFVWFQGFNDLVDSHAYPERNTPKGYELYSTLLAQFIRDVRKDLAAPKLPFVIGVLGVDGPQEKPGSLTYFRQAMAAPANLPEFKGTVVNVMTEKYWDSKLGELVARKDKIRAKSAELKKDKSLTAAQQAEMLKKYQAELFTAEELKTLEEGTSNAAYHYLGAAKIMAPIGKAFAEAMADVMPKGK